MRADSLSSTEETSKFSTSNSRGVFPQEYVCERDPVFFCFKCKGSRNALFNLPEKTRVFNGHPRRNSRIYPSFPPQLEKNHETSPSGRDDARYPCIACRATLGSQSNMEGSLMCLMELQRVLKITLTSLEWHWCHQRNVKLIGLSQINSRWRPTKLYWI